MIRSFNDDKPYSQFVIEQLAGDEVDPQNPDALVATGFLRHGIYEYNQVDLRRQRDEILSEVTDVTADVFLAMGMGLRALPRSQVRPDLADGLLPVSSLLRPDGVARRHPSSHARGAGPNMIRSSPPGVTPRPAFAAKSTNSKPSAGRSGRMIACCAFRKIFKTS